MSRKLVNVFENREMRFGFLVLCFALMGHRSNVMLERNSKNIYTQKNAEHVNEFCHCCNASLINNIRRYMEVRFNSELAQAEAQANCRAR